MREVGGDKMTMMERLKSVVRIAIAIVCGVVLLDHVLFAGRKLVPKDCECTCTPKEVRE